MKIGIVGSEETKFTPLGRARAISLITELIGNSEVTEVISGECHLGGIDIWAKEAALNLGKIFTGFAPKNLAWDTGYKPRNLQIANASDIVHCITVDKLPLNYDGAVFKLCYHCGVDTHVKSGGCWTMKKCKQGKLHVIANF